MSHHISYMYILMSHHTLVPQYDQVLTSDSLQATLVPDLHQQGAPRPPRSSGRPTMLGKESIWWVTIALHCIALHFIALHCILLHCILLHCIALHCILLHCILLHCIALHCIALVTLIILTALIIGPLLIVKMGIAISKQSCFKIYTDTSITYTFNHL